MKKLFISVPMKGRTEENIRKSMKKMHKIAEAVWEQELEVIPTYIEDKPPEGAKQALWYLGKSIQLMAEADYFIGTQNSRLFGGCAVEREAAYRYEIPTYIVPLNLTAPEVNLEESWGDDIRTYDGVGG